MKQKIIPLLITTLVALRETVKEKSPLLHIDNRLYQRQNAKITTIMAENGYSPIAQKAKSGIFFYRATDGSVFDPDVHEIFDPCSIL